MPPACHVALPDPCCMQLDVTANKQPSGSLAGGCEQQLAATAKAAATGAVARRLWRQLTQRLVTRRGGSRRWAAAKRAAGAGGRAGCDAAQHEQHADSQVQPALSRAGAQLGRHATCWPSRAALAPMLPQSGRCAGSAAKMDGSRSRIVRHPPLQLTCVPARLWTWMRCVS